MLAPENGGAPNFYSFAASVTFFDWQGAKQLPE